MPVTALFGADEVALTELADRLWAALGDDAFDKAHVGGAALDGDGAAELALQAPSV